MCLLVACRGHGTAIAPLVRLVTPYQCLLSVAAVNRTKAPKAFCLLGAVGNKALLILVDSGGSHSFVDSAIAQP